MGVPSLLGQREWGPRVLSATWQGRAHHGPGTWVSLAGMSSGSRASQGEKDWLLSSSFE